MKHDLICSARKRRAGALEKELHVVLETVRRGEGDTYALMMEVADLRDAITATRDETDDFACFTCGVDVDPQDGTAGGAHFRRMSRHDGTDKIVARNSAELKFCATCYTKLHEAVAGQSVEAELGAVKARRAEAEAKRAERQG